MKKFKEIIICILIPNLIGFIGNLLGNSSSFDSINKPDFTPNKIVFPIVWIILFTLMGISSYIIYKSESNEKSDALKSYGISLIINMLWPFFFFNLHWFFFAFIWLILLIVSVIIYTFKYYKINRIASYLQIPYLLWLIFAAFLNFNVYLLN